MSAPRHDDLVPSASNARRGASRETAAACRGTRRGQVTAAARRRPEGHARGRPVNAAEPGLAVLCVPLDRLQDALLPGDERLPPRLARQLLGADPGRQQVARAGAQTAGRRDDRPASGPVAGLLADAEDQLGPVAHRDVLALAVDVDVARHALRRDGEVAADAVGAEAEVAQRLEGAELDLLSRERLRDDRAGDVARILAGSVVVEHPGDDTGDAEGVEVVHRQEVGGDLARRVDRLLIGERSCRIRPSASSKSWWWETDSRTLPYSSDVWRCRTSRAEPVVNDRLEQVERADRIRHQSHTAGATTRRRAPARRDGRRKVGRAPS